MQTRNSLFKMMDFAAMLELSFDAIQVHFASKVMDFAFKNDGFCIQKWWRDSGAWTWLKNAEIMESCPWNGWFPIFEKRWKTVKNGGLIREKRWKTVKNGGFNTVQEPAIGGFMSAGLTDLVQQLQHGLFVTYEKVSFQWNGSWLSSEKSWFPSEKCWIYNWIPGGDEVGSGGE